MPNYVRNVLHFSGNEKLINKMLALVKGQNQFDFNKIIPMPEDLNIESSSVMAASLEYYKYTITGKMTDKLFEIYKRNNKNESIDACFNRLLQEKAIDKLLGQTAYNNMKKYGYTDWYGWCIANWGTKWNSLDVTMEDNNRICFSTAWNAPIPVIEKLAALYPALKFHHLWADEDLGSNTGDYIYRKGIKIQTIEPGSCSNDAYMIYEICWGKSDCLKCDSNGNYTRLDCDDCRKCR